MNENVAKYAGVQRDIFLYTVEGTLRETVHGDGAGKRTERGNKIKSVNVSSSAVHPESSCTENLALGEEIATEWNVDRSIIAFLFERKAATVLL